MEWDFALEISVEIQPTHTFDFNAQDALFHAELKRQLLKERVPKNNDDLQENFLKSVWKITERSIQRGFMRVCSRDANLIRISPWHPFRYLLGMKIMSHL